MPFIKLKFYIDARSTLITFRCFSKATNNNRHNIPCSRCCLLPRVSARACPELHHCLDCPKERCPAVSSASGHGPLFIPLPLGFLRCRGIGAGQLWHGGVPSEGNYVIEKTRNNLIAIIIFSHFCRRLSSGPAQSWITSRS